VEPGHALIEEYVARIAAGESPGAVVADASADAERAFALVERGLEIRARGV